MSRKTFKKMRSKQKLKSAGKLKKVSMSKLSNKRLNKLAKQGKLKRKLPKRELLKIAKERVQKNQFPESAIHGSEEHHNEADIPLHETDYQYFANPDRDLGFLTKLDSGEKSSRKRKKNDSEDILEERYEKQPRRQLGDQKELKALLPIKTKEKGLQLRMVEVKEPAEEEEPEKTIEEQPEAKEEIEVFTTAELFLNRKRKLSDVKMKIASLSSHIIENPHENVSRIRDLRLMLENNDPDVIITCKKLTMVSLLEVFKDIIPDYAIRTATDKEKEQSMKKETKMLRDFEETLLSNYRNFLEFLEAMAKGKQIKSKDKKKSLQDRLDSVRLPEEAQAAMKLLSVRCLCELLVTHPHFNYRTNIIAVVIPLVASRSTEICDIVCSAIRKVFQEDRQGDVVLEIVRSVGRVIKSNHFHVKPKILETFLSLRIKEVDHENKEMNNKKDRKQEISRMSRRDRKRKKQMRELEKELEEAAVIQNKSRKLRLNTEIINAVFLTYFRVLKQARDSVLLSTVLEGIAKFAHLINVEFFDDLFAELNNLVDSGDLTYRECLHCVQTAFVILSGQGSALNIDPQRFYKHLYSNLFELSAAGSSEDVPVALECLDMMISKRKRQISQQRLLSFIKRLCTLSLQQSADSALALLAAARNFIVSDSRSEMLFDTDYTGSGNYLPELEDPEHCNAHCTSLYELHLTKRHYHPVVRKYSEHLLKGYTNAGWSATIPAELARKTSQELYGEYNQSEMVFNPVLPEKPNKLKKLFLNGGFLQKEVSSVADTVLQSQKTDNLKVKSFR